MKKKKKTEVREARMGYCPFSQFESRYNFYIVTQGSRARARGATTQPGWGHDTAGRAQGCAAARARGLAGGACRDTINCIGKGERPGR